MKHKSLHSSVTLNMDSGGGFSVLQLACWVTLDKLHFEAPKVLIMMELSNVYNSAFQT